MIYTPLNQYYVVLEAAPSYWQTPDGLKALYFNSVGSSTGVASANAMAPLATVSTTQTGTTPLQVNHTGVFPSVTVSFNLAPNVSLSAATAGIQRTERQIGMPTSITGFFAGTLQAYQQSLSSEPILIVTALLAVYIVLGILYESLIHPLTIISTLPSASVGAMLALMLFHNDLNVMSIIGIVLLIGIVKKNGIMMIDFALAAEREQGKSTRDSIFEACMLRFRPIMMTTLAAMFGACPGARHRHGFGAAPSAGDHHRRRPAAQSAPHPVHHAGGLSRTRSPASAFRRETRPRAAANGRNRVVKGGHSFGKKRNYENSNGHR